MKICSFVPSATEILFALGLGDSIVGVSHECDVPAEALTKPRLLSTVVDQQRMTSEQIDTLVRTSLAHHQSLYRVDQAGLRAAAPELIITQDLCEVCAVDTAVVTQALHSLPYRPAVISLHPHTLADILDDIRRIGEAAGRQAQAGRLVESLRARLATVQQLVDGQPRPRVFCCEWFQPLMASGHWVPEQVTLAGGEEVIGRAGGPSGYVTWESIEAAAPEVIVLMPCGFSLQRAHHELAVLTRAPAWRRLPAVRTGQVYLINGPAYFNCSGPRLVDGVELLAALLHPDCCAAPTGTATHFLQVVSEKK